MEPSKHTPPSCTQGVWCSPSGEIKNESNDIFSWPLANAFNDFISANAIRELPRGEPAIHGPIIRLILLDQCLIESSFVPGGIPCSLGLLLTPNALSVLIIPP